MLPYSVHRMNNTIATSMMITAGLTVRLSANDRAEEELESEGDNEAATASPGHHPVAAAEEQQRNDPLEDRQQQQRGRRRTVSLLPRRAVASISPFAQCKCSRASWPPNAEAIRAGPPPCASPVLSGIGTHITAAASRRERNTFVESWGVLLGGVRCRWQATSLADSSSSS